MIHGVTPIHSAAHNGRTDLVRLLADNGADINAIMDDGQTLFSKVKEANFSKMADLIRDLGGS